MTIKSKLKMYELFLDISNIVEVFSTSDNIDEEPLVNSPQNVRRRNPRICINYSWYIIYTDFIWNVVFQVPSFVNLKEVVQNKALIIVFETFSLLSSSIANKHLHLTFIIPNTRSRVTLAEDKFLLKFFSCAERLWLSMF